jgi:hypothetical protein
LVSLAALPKAWAGNPGKPAGGQPAATSAPKPLAETLPPELRTVYEAGKILFQDGDFATALLKFQEAYARAKDARLLWNMAACQKNLRHYATALDLINKYVAEGGSSLSAQDRADAADAIAAIEPFTTMATFRINEEGAEVWLDQESLGKAPLVAPIRIDIGMRSLRVQKVGFRTYAKEVPVGGAKEVTVDVALEREGGRLELRVAADATVLIDEKEVGHGPLVALELPVGGHAVRITAPKMRPYQGEVAIEDAQTRSIEIKLEPDAEQFAELRVAVGCREADVQTPEHGLTVFLDNSPVSASALGVRKRMDQGKEVVAYVPFTVSPGRHAVRVQFPNCRTLSTDANALPQKPAVVEGILPPETPWLNGTPAGSPNGFVVSAGVTMNTLHFRSFGNLFGSGSTTQPVSSSSDVGVAAAGPSGSIGLQKRWFTLLGDVRWLTGSTTGGGQGVVYGGPRPVLAQTNEAASLQEADLGLRMGPRIPIYLAALSFGVGGNLGYLSISPAQAGLNSNTWALLGGNLWATVDVQPLCDWGLQIGGALSAVVNFAGGSSSSSSCGYGGTTACASSSSADPQARFATTFFVQAAYEPNRLCERERAGLFRLEGTQ